MASPTPKTVLITGCTDGTAGAALARQFHLRGLRVFATSRKVENMAGLAAMGIETLALDVTSSQQIREVVAAVRERILGKSTRNAEEGGTEEEEEEEEEGDRNEAKLDILVNNAGYWNLMTLADQDLDAARQMFEINYFGLLAVTQAFLPLLVRTPIISSSAGQVSKTKSGSKHHHSVIANVGSISSLVAPPYQGIYAASKAAVAASTNTLRLELAPLGVKVVHILAGGLATRFLEVAAWKYDTNTDTDADAAAATPAAGITSGMASSYYPRVIRDKVETRSFMPDVNTAMQPDEYAKRVVGDLLRVLDRGRKPGDVARGSYISMVLVALRLGLAGVLEKMFVKQSGLGDL